MTDRAPSVLILSPDPADASWAGRWREVYDRMAGPLSRAGVAVEHRPWIEAGTGEGFDLVLPLVAWGYHRQADRWRETIARLEAAGTRLLNPGATLRWNTDKAYLAELDAAGAPVIPSLSVDRLAPEHLVRAADRFGTEALVAKPRISAGAFRTVRLRPGDPVDAGPEGPTLIQPFMDKVLEDGELSLIFFDRRFSHAIRKVPKAGDFRVQPEYDGIITAYDPDADALRAAEAILARIEGPLLYARVDLVRGPDGAPLLIELELIEPDLYLGFAADRGAAFERAFREAAFAAASTGA